MASSMEAVTRESTYVDCQVIKYTQVKGCNEALIQQSGVKSGDLVNMPYNGWGVGDGGVQWVGRGNKTIQRRQSYQTSFFMLEGEH